MKKLGILIFVVILRILLMPPTLIAQARAIDSSASKLRVYVSKAGLFSALGDNHEIEVPISQGFIDEGVQKVKFTIDARRLTVLDRQLSPYKRQQVQECMLGPEVLDARRFPEIRFESTSVDQAVPDRLLVCGQLELHGLRRPVVVSVRTESGHYIGSSTFRQREFGITPISIAGGTVKVKDELKTEFDIRTTTQAAEIRSK